MTPAAVRTLTRIRRGLALVAAVLVATGAARAQAPAAEPRPPLSLSLAADGGPSVSIDGIYFEYEGFSATFLPQVWESLPDAQEFLEALRHKAGLPRRFWHPGVRLTRYTVEKFADERANA